MLHTINVRKEIGKFDSQVFGGLDLKDLIILITMLFLTVPLLSGCIQKGVVVPEHEVTFTFNETDELVTATEIKKLLHAQVEGSFNDWETDVIEWQWLKFNDRGIPPDETAGDKRWTAKVSLPVERYISYKFLLVGLNEDDEETAEEIKDPNNPQEDGDGNSLLIIQ
ncbi:MAG: hypothetical protein QGH40_17070 [bacterium]|jgi:hypothetical protein|nr:hypothetical protein [bacterium]